MRIYISDLKNHVGQTIELKGWAYRQIVEPPCRVFYRHERQTVYILHVMRSEQRLPRSKLTKRGAEEKES